MEFLQITLKREVNVATGDVRVDGEVVDEMVKANHVEVRPTGVDLMPTTGRIIMFKDMTRGFSKEVKLTRPVTA